MPTSTETITITSTGANNYTKTMPVVVDVTTGMGLSPFSVLLQGTNAGLDTITVSMTSHSPVYTSNSVQVAWYGATTLLPRFSGEECPMYILQGDAGGHPRPYDGSDVSLHPGNIVTVYYNDIHDVAQPPYDQTLLTAIGGNPSVYPSTPFVATQNAHVVMNGGTLPSQYTNGPFHGGAQRVTAMGEDKPYHDTQDTHSWLQFICPGPPLGLWANYGSAAGYNRAVVSPILAPAVGTAGTTQLQLTPVDNGSNN